MLCKDNPAYPSLPLQTDSPLLWADICVPQLFCENINNLTYISLQSNLIFILKHMHWNGSHNIHVMRYGSHRLVSNNIARINRYKQYYITMLKLKRVDLQQHILINESILHLPNGLSLTNYVIPIFLLDKSQICFHAWLVVLSQIYEKIYKI